MNHRKPLLRISKQITEVLYAFQPRYRTCLLYTSGYSLIPLSVYFKGPRVKLEIGLAKGKKLYDKRESAARRDAKREMDRTMKSQNTRY